MVPFLFFCQTLRTKFSFPLLEEVGLSVSSCTSCFLLHTFPGIPPSALGYFFLSSCSDFQHWHAAPLLAGLFPSLFSECLFLAYYLSIRDPFSPLTHLFRYLILPFPPFECGTSSLCLSFENPCVPPYSAAFFWEED